MENLTRRSRKLKVNVQHATVLSQSTNNKCYETTSFNRGIVNILNIRTPDFIQDTIPADSFQIDTENLKNVFTQMGLTVFTHFEKQDVEDVLNAFGKEEQLKTADIAILILLGHGDRVDACEYISSWNDNDKIYYNDVIESFSNSVNENIKAKPKLLFFEVGREDETNYSIRCEFIEETAMMVVYSTVPIYEDRYSSMFVPHLCKELMYSAYKLDFMSMLTNIINGINEELLIKDCRMIPWIMQENQMPHLYFNPGIYKNETENVCKLNIGANNDTHVASIDIVDQSGATKLHYAASEGDLYKVQLLLKMGANKYIQDDTCFAPIHCAIEKGHLSICKCILENEVDMDEKYKRKDGLTLLHLASYMGNIQITEWLLSKAVNINITDQDGWSCLHYAAHSGNLELVQFLISKTVNKDMSTKNNVTPLHCALVKGHVDICEELLDFASDMDVKYKLKDEGMTLLQLASKHGQMEVAKWLLSKGVDIEATDIHKWTALHHAAQNGHLKMVKYLLQNGSKMDAPDGNNFTPLHCAVRNGHLSIAKELFENDVDIDAKYSLTDDGMTLVELASLVGFIDIFEWLLSKGVSINCSQVSGWTCLHYAALRGHLEIVKMLLAAGANKDACNEYSYTPIQYAVSEGHVNVFEELLDDGVDLDVKYLQDGLTLLHLASKDGHVNVAKRLLSKGVNIDMPSADRSTALHFAASHGHLKMVTLLVTNGANKDETNEYKHTPLHCAVKKGRVHIVKWLLSNGVNINITDKNGWTALHYAANLGSLEIVQLLIAKGALKEIENNKNYIPLHYAVSRGHVDVVSTLFDIINGEEYKVKKGGVSLLHLASKNGQIEMAQYLLLKNIDIDISDKNGWTALHYACNKGHLKMVQYLIEKGANTSITTKCNKLPYNVAFRNDHIDICDYLDLLT